MAWTEDDLQRMLGHGQVRLVNEMPQDKKQDEPLCLLLSIPIRLRSVANLREHWTAKAKRTKQERLRITEALWAQAGKRRGPPMGRITITLTRIAPRFLDDDNLRSAFKATRDGIAAWLLVQDNHPLLIWEYAQRNGRPKEYAVEIGIHERRE